VNTLAEYIKFNGTTESQYLDNQNELGSMKTWTIRTYWDHWILM